MPKPLKATHTPSSLEDNTMPKRKSLKRMKVTITLRKHVLDAIDELAGMVETTRSDVLDSFADYCLKNEEIIDEIFPILEEEAEDKEEIEDEIEEEEA